MLGLQILSSPFAVSRHEVWEVVPHPIRKRRKGWAAKRRWIEVPAAYSLPDGRMVMHPTLYAKLKETP